MVPYETLRLFEAELISGGVDYLVGTESLLVALNGVVAEVRADPGSLEGIAEIWFDCWIGEYPQDSDSIHRFVSLVGPHNVGFCSRLNEQGGLEITLGTAVAAWEPAHVQSFAHSFMLLTVHALEYRRLMQQEFPEMVLGPSTLDEALAWLGRRQGLGERVKKKPRRRPKRAQ
jgi:hypothetical protein